VTFAFLHKSIAFHKCKKLKKQGCVLFLRLQLDASADGYVRAEAAAMIALAHPSYAQGSDAAPVLGFLASSAVNQVIVDSIPLF
jgi:acyl transferase domain-containing protein